MIAIAYNARDCIIIAPADMPYPIALAVKKLRRKEILGAPNDAGERQVIGHTIEVEMHDKLQPLRLFGLELGVFVEKTQHTADDALLEAMRRGRERALAG